MRTPRVRGGFGLIRTLGLCGDTTYSFRPRPLPLLHSYFFRGGDLNWNGVAKRRGGLPVKKQEAVGMKCKCRGDSFILSYLIVRG